MNWRVCSSVRPLSADGGYVCTIKPPNMYLSQRADMYVPKNPKICIRVPSNQIEFLRIKSSSFESNRVPSNQIEFLRIKSSSFESNRVPSNNFFDYVPIRFC